MEISTTTRCSIWNQWIIRLVNWSRKIGERDTKVEKVGMWKNSFKFKLTIKWIFIHYGLFQQSYSSDTHTLCMNIYFWNISMFNVSASQAIVSPSNISTSYCLQPVVVRWYIQKGLPFKVITTKIRIIQNECLVSNLILWILKYIFPKYVLVMWRKSKENRCSRR